MKKILLMIALLGSITLGSFAQTKDGGKFSVGVEIGKPVGDASNVSSITVGGSVKYDLPIAAKTYFTLSGGYTYFPYKNDITIQNIGVVTTNSGEGFVPLKAGVKYFLSDLFYGEAQLGASISTASGGGAAFAYAPGVGYQFDKNADIGFRYEGWSKNGYTTSQFALRLAYSF